VVFRLPSYELLLFGSVEATRSNSLPKQTGMGPESRLRLTVPGSDNRAHRGKAKIKARLIADLNPDEWELPPKPKWMRWRTYNRYVERFDRYEDILTDGIEGLAAKLLDEKYSQ
jgi:hypothetical protein